MKTAKGGKERTDKIPSSGLSCISQLVVGSEYEENFWCHCEVILDVAGGCLMSMG
jgi:hypothetical protein